MLLISNQLICARDLSPPFGDIDQTNLAYTTQNSLDFKFLVSESLVCFRAVTVVPNGWRLFLLKTKMFVIVAESLKNLTQVDLGHSYIKPYIFLFKNILMNGWKTSTIIASNDKNATTETSVFSEIFELFWRGFKTRYTQIQDVWRICE